MSRKTRTCHLSVPNLRVLLTGICLFAVAVTSRAQEVVYELVTDESQLVDGGKYIIVDKAHGTAMGWQDSDNRKGADIKEKIDGNTIRGIVLATSAKDKTNVYEFSLYKNKSSKNKWGFYDSVHKKFLCAHHLDKNGIELLAPTNSVDNPVPTKAEATISFSESKEGKITIIKFKSNDKNETRVVMDTYRGNVYACYNQQSPTISLYRKRVGTISISQYGYTTYATEYPYRMPKGCTGLLVSTLEDNTGGKLLLTEGFKENEIVPGKTPLLIKGEPGEYAIYQTARANTSNPGENLLHADYDEEGNITYGSDKNENYYYYKLTTKNGANVGFYWGEQSGGPFKMKNQSRAYLVLPREQSEVKGLVLDDAMVETGVALPVQGHRPNGKVYDLQGRPCRGLRPGIYIQDGRKILVGK